MGIQALHIQLFGGTGATGQTVTMYAASMMADKNGNTNDNDLLLTSQASGTLPQAPNVTATITQMKNPTCYGFTNGTMTVTASNGTPPYTYAWSNGQTTAMATNLRSRCTYCNRFRCQLNDDGC